MNICAFFISQYYRKPKERQNSKLITFKYTIGDKHGIHARPAGVLVNCAKRFNSDITIQKGEKTADAKRLISIMSLAGKHGEELLFTVSGNDEQDAARELERCCHENIG